MRRRLRMFAVPAVAALCALAPAAARAASWDDLRLVSYYPSAAPWTRMWTDWNAATVQADFGRARSIHANAVRLIVFPQVVGYPVAQSAQVARLREAIALAQAAGLKVELTLFDWWDDYGDQAGSSLWLSTLLSGLPTADLALVELKNEIDPANAAAMSWARTLLPQLHVLLPNVPTTLSVPGSLGPAGLAALRAQLGSSAPDVYSFHLYAAPGTARAQLAAARAAVAPAPMIVGETGAPSLPADGQSPRAAELDQDAILRGVYAAARELGLPPPAPWTLMDFQPGSVPAGAAVADRPSELHMGLFRTDGSAKRAAATVTRAFSGATIGTAFNNGFEQADGARPALWSVYEPLAGAFARDRHVHHGGRASARLSRTGGDATGVPAFVATPVDPPPLDHPVHAQAWARGRRLTGRTRLALAFFAADGRYLGQAESPDLPRGTTRWRLLQVTATPPAGTASLQIHLKSANDRGSAWFDDVRLAAG